MYRIKIPINPKGKKRRFTIKERKEAIVSE